MLIETPLTDNGYQLAIIISSFQLFYPLKPCEIAIPNIINITISTMLITCQYLYPQPWLFPCLVYPIH